MTNVTGTVKIAGLTVDIDLTIDETCSGECENVSLKYVEKKNEPNKESGKKKETKQEKPEEKQSPAETPAVTVEQVTSAAVAIAELGPESIKTVKETIKMFSDTGMPKVATVPKEKLGDLLEAINNIKDEIK